MVRSSMPSDAVTSAVQESLRDCLRGSEADPLDATTPLLDSGLLDSLALVELLVRLEEAYAVAIPDDDLEAKFRANCAFGGWDGGRTEQLREALLLVEIGGLTCREAAETLGIPEGTVKSRLFRGRRILQKKLVDYAVEMGYVRTRGDAE
jgi:acyl carrier protein